MTVSKIMKGLFIIAIVQLVILAVYEVKAAPGVSMAGAGGTGAMAGTDEDGNAIAMSGIPMAPQAGSGGTSVGSGSSGTSGGTSILTRSGGGSVSKPSKTQTVVVGSNGGGDTTILQQSGDQPPKVYKISSG